MLLEVKEHEAQVHFVQSNQIVAGGFQNGTIPGDNTAVLYYTIIEAGVEIQRLPKNYTFIITDDTERLGQKRGMNNLGAAAANSLFHYVEAVIRLDINLARLSFEQDIKAHRSDLDRLEIDKPRHDPLCGFVVGIDELIPLTDDQTRRLDLARTGNGGHGAPLSLTIRAGGADEVKTAIGLLDTVHLVTSTLDSDKLHNFHKIKLLSN